MFFYMIFISYFLYVHVCSVDRSKFKSVRYTRNLIITISCQLVWDWIPTTKFKIDEDGRSNISNIDLEPSNERINSDFDEITLVKEIKFEMSKENELNDVQAGDNWIKFRVGLTKTS